MTARHGIVERRRSPVRILAALVAAAAAAGSAFFTGAGAFFALQVGDAPIAGLTTLWCLGSLLSLAFIFEWGR